MSDAVAALRAGEPVILPTDTVYGLCAAVDGPAPTERLYRLKGRDAAQPSALLAADLDTLFDCVPELRGRGEQIARALLPGAYTLILPNPARRYSWLTGASPESIGVRVAPLPGPAAQVLAEVGAVVATSANLPGEPEPRRVEDVPLEFRGAVGAVVDAGELPGRSSTVIDFTGAEPRVLREGAGSVADALSALA
jgi:tRNA threonylcarbamoyl adenosine modification protein (Sua5/YciO/YrdC/YwlC family)